MSNSDHVLIAAAKRAGMAAVLAAAFASAGLAGSPTAAADCVVATGGAVVDCDGTNGESRDQAVQGNVDYDGTQNVDSNSGIQNRSYPAYVPQYRP